MNTWYAIESFSAHLFIEICLKNYQFCSWKHKVFDQEENYQYISELIIRKFK